MRSILFLFLLLVFSLSCASPKALRNGKIKFDKNVPVMLTDLKIDIIPEEKNIKQFIAAKFLPEFKLGNDVTPQYLNVVDTGDTKIFKYSYKYKGIPIENSFTTVAVKKGKIYRITNSLPELNLNTENIISADEAAKSAYAAHTKENVSTEVPTFYGKKIILKVLGKYIVAYKVRFVPKSLTDTRHYYVSAKNGNFLFSTTNIVH